MNRILKITAVTVPLLLFFTFSTQQVFAEDVFIKAKANLGDTNLSSGSTVTTQTLPERIGYFLNVIYSALGLIAIILIIWGGFKWIVSGGDSKKIASAKEQILYTIVGLAVVILAYSITTYIIDKLPSLK